MDGTFMNITSDVFNPVNVFEVKILLAYFLDKIDREVTPAQLREIATGDGVVNYFLYAEAIEQMLQNGTLLLTEREGTEYYELTDAGRNGAESFKGIVNKSVRDRIYAAGLKLFAKLRAEQEVRFELTECDKGYKVRCICEDGGLTLMDMTLFAPDKEQAEYIKAKVLINPSEFYSNVLDYVILNEEFVPDLNEEN